MQEVNFLQSMHSKTQRDYFARMNAEKPECMRIAKQYGQEYWDGDRKYGYGGYKYDGRYRSVADAMMKYYKLKEDSKILDIGCGKGFLLSDIKSKLKWARVCGIDVSKYALDLAPDNVRLNLRKANCMNLPCVNMTFDFVYSIGCFHNLNYSDLKKAINEMLRVSKSNGKQYICVESYRNEEELCALQCWALTCASFFTPDDWMNILSDNGYNGDVEFLFFT